jgi:opacity protein-like surface antigen
MKKIAIASIIAMAATAASALDVGVTTTADHSGVNKNTGYGVTVGKQAGALSVTGGFDRFTQGSNDQDRFSVVAGYDVAKFGPVTVTPKLGMAYLNNQSGADGYAMTVGIGASVPVTKRVAFTVDAARQYGQDRVRASDGNTITAGLKYKF